jgi:hypothetical protein
MPGARIAPGTARRAVRYAGATVFFMDDRSFAEPEGFWVGGARSSAVVVQPDIPGRPVSLLVRNGPVQNVAVLHAGASPVDLPLSPGEERRVDLPASGGATMVTVAAASGFRPSETDPKSRDTRFLGVWVKIVE